jgi:hypothetical protein
MQIHTQGFIKKDQFTSCLKVENQNLLKAKDIVEI